MELTFLSPPSSQELLCVFGHLLLTTSQDIVTKAPFYCKPSEVLSQEASRYHSHEWNPKSCQFQANEIPTALLTRSGGLPSLLQGPLPPGAAGLFPTVERALQHT